MSGAYMHVDTCIVDQMEMGKQCDCMDLADRIQGNLDLFGAM